MRQFGGADANTSARLLHRAPPRSPLSLNLAGFACSAPDNASIGVDSRFQLGSPVPHPITPRSYSSAAGLRGDMNSSTHGLGASGRSITIGHEQSVVVHLLEEGGHGLGDLRDLAGVRVLADVEGE